MKYIQDLITTFHRRIRTPQKELESVFGSEVPAPARLLGAIIKELNRVDPRDFERAARHDFVVFRSMIAAWHRNGASTFNGEVAAKFTVKLAGLLDFYLGQGSRAETRDFSFVVAPDVRKIVEPRKKAGAVKDITKQARDDEWSLSDLIKVSCDLTLLPYDDEMPVHFVLREYRNLVHPRLEVKMGISTSEGDATVATGMLDVILDHLTP